MQHNINKMASYIDELLDTAVSQRNKMDFPIILVLEDKDDSASSLIGRLFASHYPSYYVSTDGSDMDVAMQVQAIPTHVEVAVIGLQNIAAINDTCQILQPTHGISLLSEERIIYMYKSLEKIRGLMFINNAHQALISESAMYFKKIFFAESHELSTENLPIEVLFEANTVSFLNDKGERFDVKTMIENKALILACVTLGRYFKIPIEKIIAVIQNG